MKTWDRKQKMPLNYIYYQVTKENEPENMWDDMGFAKSWLYYDRKISAPNVSVCEGGIKRYTQDDVINEIKEITSGFGNMSPINMTHALDRIKVWGDFLCMLVHDNCDTTVPQSVLYVKYPAYHF